MSKRMGAGLALCVLLAGAPVLAEEELVVRIAHVGPLTGPIGHLGKDNENGAVLAIEDANAQHIVIGGKPVRFELLAKDDGADPIQGVGVARAIVASGAKGVVGHLNSGVSIPASKIYAAAGLPEITPASTNPKYTHQGLENTFRMVPDDQAQGRMAAQFIVERLGAHRVIVVDDRTAYGGGLGDMVADVLGRAGVESVKRQYGTDRTTDWSNVADKIATEKPDAVFYGGMDATAAPLVAMLRKKGVTTPFVVGDGGCTPEMLKLTKMLKGELDSPLYCTETGVPRDEMRDGAAFFARFRQRFGVDVQIYAPYTYDAVWTLIRAMQAADSVEPAQYLPALKKLDIQGLTGRIRFDPNGDLLDGATIVRKATSNDWQLQEVLRESRAGI